MIAGVPREVQLTIRNETGQVWMPRQIWLQEVRYKPEDIETARRDEPAEALTNGGICFVFVALKSASDSPDT